MPRGKGRREAGGKGGRLLLVSLRGEKSDFRVLPPPPPLSELFSLNALVCIVCCRIYTCLLSTEAYLPPRLYSFPGWAGRTRAPRGVYSGTSVSVKRKKPKPVSCLLKKNMTQLLLIRHTPGGKMSSISAAAGAVSRTFRFFFCTFILAMYRVSGSQRSQPPFVKNSCHTIPEGI